MIRIMHIDSDGVVHASEDLDQVKPPPFSVITWIDVEDATKADLDMLGERFNFHPLTIDDCAHFDQNPKLEDYGDYIFLVTHAFSLPKDLEKELVGIVELHSFISRNYLVTVHDQPLAGVDIVWKRLLGDPKAARRGPDFIRYLLAHELTNELYPLIDQLADDTEEVESQLFNELPAQNVLHEILRIKRLNVTMRKALIPQRNIMASLSKVEDRFINKKTSIYFRDIYDSLLRVTEALESNREILENVLTGYQWAISQRTNEVVKRLTLLSAIFLPLTFITGFFGQNFRALPFESAALLMVMLSSCILVPGLMLWYFLRRNWI